jgi:hypothetical protein
MGHWNISYFSSSPQPISQFTGSQTTLGGQSGFPHLVCGDAETVSANTAKASNSNVLFTAKLLIEVEVAP